MNEIKFFRKNSLGIGTWRVWGIKHSNIQGAVHIAHCTVEGGSEVHHIDPVRVNNSGRTIEQQIDLEIKSRCSRQLDKGYKPTRDEALLGSTNQLGLVNPMLALPLSKVKLGQSHFADAYVQRKYDGHRCLITRQNGDILAYSRKGKEISTIPHILEDCMNWMQDGDTLDGELYIHGQKLQSISSLVKREQPGSRALNYHWYDIVDRTKPFGVRYRLMRDLAANIATSQIVLVPTQKVVRMAEVYDHFKIARSEGYEGSMLRVSIAGYEDAVRSNQLIKVKEREDCEVTTIGVRASARGWAILRVKTDWGTEFDISAPGSDPEKTEILQNYENKYHNRRLTIEYAMLTDDKIPFHAVAIRWREDV